MKNFTLILVLLMLIIPSGVIAVNVYTPITLEKVETGWVYINVRCQNNIFSKEMIITNSLGVETHVGLDPSGKFDMELPEGLYSLKLIDGNAGHPEYKNFYIGSGRITYVQLIGHAFSGNGNFTPYITPTPTPIVTPIPTVTPTQTPTIVPTPTITLIPTLTPTPSPTPTQNCHKEKVCTPGYWEFPGIHVNCIIKPIWHPEVCEWITVCN